MPERTVSLRPGECHVERLPGRGTVGYEWQAELDGDVGSVAVSLAGAGPPPGPPLAGASVDEVAEIRAVAAGHALVRLRQLRPWEPTQVLDERVIHVVVVP